MPDGDQLTPQQFAAKIKAKYPDYANIPDNDLVQKMIGKYPEYKSRIKFETAPAAPVKPETERAMQFGPGGTPMFVDVPKGQKQSFEAAGRAGYAQGGKIGLEMVGGAVGGEAGAGVKGLVGLGARAIGAGIGTGAGNVAGQAAGTGKVDFWEAVKSGGAAALLEPLGELGGKAFGRLSKLWKADPTRLKDIGDVISFEERTRQVVQTKAPEILRGINASYPTLPDIPIMPAAKTAQVAEKKMAATAIESVPRQVGKLADIGTARQREAIKLLSRARTLLQQQDASDEVVSILDKARQAGKMSFMDAQQVKSSLGKLLRKGNLPGPQYQAAKSSYEAIRGSIEDVAEQSGQLSAYRAAEDKVALWHADFDSSGAPLKKLMDAKPDERGKILEHLLSDPDSRVRATEALKRWGFNTAEVQRLAERWRDPAELKKLIGDAARAEQIGEKAFGEQEIQTTRKKLGDFVTKKLIPYGGAGAATLYELFKRTASKSPTMHP